VIHVADIISTLETGIEQAETGQRHNQWAGPLPVAVNARWAEELLLTIALVLVDLTTVLAGFWLAYALRFRAGIDWLYEPEVAPVGLYSGLVLLLAPLWVVIFRLFGLYEFKHLFAGMQEYARVFNACLVGMMLIILSSFFFPTFIIARGWVVLSWLLVTFSVLLGRFALRRLVQRMRVRGRFLTTVLVVGANEEGQAIASQLRDNPKAGICIAGFADDQLPEGSQPLPGTAVLGSVSSVASLIRQHGVQEILVATTALSREQLLDLFQDFGVAKGITLRMSSGLYEIMTTGVEVHDIGNVPLLSINRARLSPSEMFLKRMLDLLVSSIVLLASCPLLLVIGLAIKLDSRGPIFYRRRVVGVGGKVFDAFKFRSMYLDADERLAQDPELRRQFEQNHKLKDDPRVTSVGRFLRRTSLDELPQFLNVLWGQMSLVGPRMITLEERARYGKWWMNLFTVKPGITGLWQVSGRSNVSYEERVMLDMRYIRNYSIWLDLHLLYRTIPTVLKGSGAY
jgi:exopolysaccharide biosynthesis polyprenyl glycosylphosphotransferase